MKISIACCTYNGEKYLKEQLDSLENQTLRPFEVVIVDDSSIDGTLGIIESFQKTSSLKIRLFKNDQNLGVVKSFEKAISLCAGDYFSLCDQDDVWLPEKLEIFSKKMNESEEKYGKETPLLVFSDLKVVDKNLNIISTSMFKYYGRKQLEGNPLNSIFLQNIVTGCASMFNKPLASISLPFGRGAFVHDWWIALTACAFGKIVPIPKSTILYRQHGHNSIGAVKGSNFQKLKKIFKVTQINENLNKIYFQTNDFLLMAQKYNLDFPELKQTIDTMDRGGVSAIIFFLQKKIYPENIINRLRFFQCLFFRPILKYIKYKSFKFKNSPRLFKRILNFYKQKILFLLPIPPKSFDKIKIFELYKNPENKKHKNLVLFAHFTTKSSIDQSLKYYLNELAKLDVDIALCTTMKNSISQEDLLFLKEHCLLIIRKENLGLDFGSWDTLYKQIDFPQNYEKIIFANDSVVGPFRPLGPLMEQFKKLDLDYMGLTSSHQIKLHYQSYFLIFGKKLISSDLWTDFWKNFKYYHSKLRIIRDYEVGFSNSILNSGFHCKALWDYDDLHDALNLKRDIIYNPVHDLGLSLFEKLKFPFLKKALYSQKKINLP